jgi:hypothetical protein
MYVYYDVQMCELNVYLYVTAVQMCGLRPVGAEQGGPRHLHRGRFCQERSVTGSNPTCYST